MRFRVEETDVCLLPDYRPAATLKAAQRVKPHGRHMTVCTETPWKCCFQTCLANARLL